MSVRLLLFVLLAGLAGVSIAQPGTYSSTFGDYQSWRDGGPADWRDLNRTVAAADSHAGHGATAATGQHDHGSGSAGAHDQHGHGKSGMAEMHKKMHGDGKGHDMSDMHKKMHGGGKGHDMSGKHTHMHDGKGHSHDKSSPQGGRHGKAGAGGHQHGADAGKKP